VKRSKIRALPVDERRAAAKGAEKFPAVDVFHKNTSIEMVRRISYL